MFIYSLLAVAVAATGTTMTTSTSSAAPQPTGYPTCPSDGKPCHDPFYLKCKNVNGFSGYVQSQNDGQVFCGANNGISGCGSDAKPYFTLLSNGGIIDSRGRLAEIDPTAQQFQFNLDPSQAKNAQSGFAIGTCPGSGPALTYKGVSTFYACGQNSARIYAGTQVPAGNPQANGCQPFTLSVEYIL